MNKNEVLNRYQEKWKSVIEIMNRKPKEWDYDSDGTLHRFNREKEAEARKLARLILAEAYRGGLNIRDIPGADSAISNDFYDIEREEYLRILELRNNGILYKVIRKRSLSIRKTKRSSKNTGKK